SRRLAGNGVACDVAGEDGGRAGVRAAVDRGARLAGAPPAAGAARQRAHAGRDRPAAGCARAAGDRARRWPAAGSRRHARGHPPAYRTRARGFCRHARGCDPRRARGTRFMKRLTLVLLAVALASLSSVAEAALPAVTVTDVPGEGQTWSLTLQVLVLMTLLTLLPGIVLAMTSFTRIVIVFSILRQALGTANSPPNQVLIGLSLFLSWFIMAPVLEE